MKNKHAHFSTAIKSLFIFPDKGNTISSRVIRRLHECCIQLWVISLDVFSASSFKNGFQSQIVYKQINIFITKPPLFIEVPLYQIRKCVCVIGISILSLSMILIFDLRIVPTLWYFLFFILLCGFKQFSIYDMIFETIYHNGNILCLVVVIIL
jgi:hypothetical protein